MQSRSDGSSNDWRGQAREDGWPESRTSARSLHMPRAESACDHSTVPLERAHAGNADNATESIADRQDRKMSLDLCVSLNCSTLAEMQQDYATAMSGVVVWGPYSCTGRRLARVSVLMCSTMWSGMRIVRPWSAIARETACRIHHVAYVENLNPLR